MAKVSSLGVPVLLVLPLCATLAAQQDRRPASRPTVSNQARHEAAAFRSLEMAGEDVAAGVAKLEELRWYTTLGGALKAGREKGRPVLWIQALGDLDGFL